jgi:hypothetical protein
MVALATCLFGVRFGMHKVWIMLLPLAIGCSDSDGGEPIEGTIMMQYGDNSPTMVAGSAVQHEGDEDMLVQIGSRSVDCGTYLDDFLDFDAPNGHFVYFSVPKVSGTYDSNSVSVDRNRSNESRSYQAFGDVVIDSVDEERVKGSVTFMATDDEIGLLAVSGSFDVLRCF